MQIEYKCGVGVLVLAPKWKEDSIIFDNFDSLNLKLGRIEAGSNRSDQIRSDQVEEFMLISPE